MASPSQSQKNFFADRGCFAERRCKYRGCNGSDKFLKKAETELVIPKRLHQSQIILYSEIIG
jgi:hypothetical protein